MLKRGYVIFVHHYLRTRVGARDRVLEDLVASSQDSRRSNLDT